MHTLFLTSSFRRSASLVIGLLSLCLSINAQTGNATKTLTLSQAISIALDQNIALQRSALSLESRESNLSQAKADRNADLNFRVSESFGLSPSDNGGILEGEGDWNDSTSASLSSSLSLYSGGAREASIAQAKAELEAASLDYDYDRQSLLYNTVSLFLRTILLSKEITIQEEELSTRIEELERININVENGIRTQAESLRQQAQVSTSQRSLAQAQNNYANSLYALKNTLRIPAIAEIVCEDSNLGIASAATLSDPDLDQSLTSLEERVDLNAQKARLTSAEQNLLISKSGNRPSVTASASLSTSYSSKQTNNLSDQFFIDHPRASAGVSVNVPIFDRRRTQLNTTRSHISLQQEELQLEILQRAARTALYQANHNYHTAKLQLAASNEQLASTEAALEIERSRYEAGAATLLDVNSLRTSRLDAAIAVEVARSDLFTSRLEVAFQDGTIESFLQQTLQSSY